MCSGSEAGSYLRLIDVVYHSTVGLRVIKRREIKKRRVFESNKEEKSLATWLAWQASCSQYSYVEDNIANGNLSTAKL